MASQDPSGPSAAGTGNGGATQTRIAELEALLQAANKTIKVLVDKAERTARSTDAAGDAPATAAATSRGSDASSAAASESRAVAAANAELRALTSNLDQIVRQRTRALAESEAQLRRKNMELERHNEMKAEFISIAAHELRTPLTSIVGYLDMMAEGKFGKPPETMDKPLSSLRRNSNRLKRLVDDMLDLSRIEAGRVVLRRAPCELGVVVGHALEELRPMADAKEQNLSLAVDTDPTMEGDSDKIHQIATNLITNALRYTPRDGTITVMVDEVPEEELAGQWARLRVRDNGIGIPNSYRATIFEPFSAVTPVKHHTSSGLDSAGLGLYIARGLVELHGGLINVESEEGEYTQFTVLFPLAATSATAARRP